MKSHSPTTSRPRRKRRAADEIIAPAAEREDAVASPAQSLEMLHNLALGVAERGRAALGLQRMLGNSAVARAMVAGTVGRAQSTRVMERGMVQRGGAEAVSAISGATPNYTEFFHHLNGCSMAEMLQILVQLGPRVMAVEAHSPEAKDVFLERMLVAVRAVRQRGRAIPEVFELENRSSLAAVEPEGRAEILRFVGLSPDRPASEITLEFTPDALLEGQDPMGQVVVWVRNQQVASFEARGGPPSPGADPSQPGGLDPNAPGHTINPTPAGKYKLAAGEAYKTRSWAYSQIPWGTPIRDNDSAGGVLFQSRKGWRSTARLEKAISRSEIIEAEAELGRAADIPASWDLNDFGKLAFRVKGAPGILIHTTPENEQQYSTGGMEKLEFSHGCIHIKPSDREVMTARGYLQGGVSFVVHPYRPRSEWGKPR